jgi:hypothetical protein
MPISLPACLGRGEQGINRLGEFGQIADIEGDALAGRTVYRSCPG